MNHRPEIVEIDLSGVRSSRELHEKLAVSLGFPEFYGHNWDAFRDAITGLVEMPALLRLRGWSSLESSLLDDARRLLSCLEDLNEQYPDSHCQVIRLPSDE